MLMASSLLDNTRADPNMTCGGVLNAPNGVIQTPNFPHRFHTPLTCTWIINASEHSHGDNSIIIYLTQLYVLNGLTFTGYVIYDPALDLQIKSEERFELKEEDATQVAWLKFSTKYLEIKFTMETVYGTHLRTLDRIIDVYGFNITYDVGTLKPYQCNTLKCRFLGHCLAEQNFR